MVEWNEDWAEVAVVGPKSVFGPMRVYDAEGTLEPEIWVREHGVVNYPHAIYFFSDLKDD